MAGRKCLGVQKMKRTFTPILWLSRRILDGPWSVVQERVRLLFFRRSHTFMDRFGHMCSELLTLTVQGLELQIVTVSTYLSWLLIRSGGKTSEAAPLQFLAVATARSGARLRADTFSGTILLHAAPAGSGCVAGQGWKSCPEVSQAINSVCRGVATTWLVPRSW